MADAVNSPPLASHVSCIGQTDGWLNGTKQLSLNECFSLSSHPRSSSGEEMKRKFLSKQNVDVGLQQTYPLYI